MGAIGRLAEGIIVLLAIILIVVGLGLFLEQKWLNATIVLSIGAAIMAARIGIRYWLTK
jgi:hypothetical protein